jgi:hypothetical protein
MSTAGGQSSKDTSKVPVTIDHNAFYVQRSAADTFKPGTDAGDAPPNTSMSHGYTVHTKKTRGEIRGLEFSDLGTATALDTIRGVFADHTKRRKELEDTQAGKQRAVDADYDADLQYNWKKLQREQRKYTHKVVFRDGPDPEPSTTALEKAGFRTLIPREVEDLEWGMTDRMREEEAVETTTTRPPKPDKFGIYDDDDVRHVRPDGFGYFFDLDVNTNLYA